MRQQMQRFIDPIIRRLSLLLGRGIIRRVDDSKPGQACQASFLEEEVRDGMERQQEYGFTSVPLPGCNAVAVFPIGDRSHGVIVATEDYRYRPVNLKPGEVCIYTHEGARVHLKAGKIVEIVADEVHFTGNLQADGDIKAGSISLRGHVHPENDSGGPTAPPM